MSDEPTGWRARWVGAVPSRVPCAACQLARDLDWCETRIADEIATAIAEAARERDRLRAALQQITDIAPECEWCDDGGAVACGEPAVARVDHTWHACERHLPRGRGTVERLLWATTARAALSDTGAVARPDTTEE